MTKKSKAEEEKKNEEYLENYKKQIQRLMTMSTFNVRQFMGTRQEGDPRVNYLAGLETFKNIVNSQLSGIVRVLTMMLGDRKQAFMKIMEEELANQIKTMESDIGIVGWNEDGTPQFDLALLKEKTKGWPA